MKKICLLVVPALFVIAACHSSGTTKPVTDSINKIPIDTVKIDTVKPTDSIIKG